MVYIIQSYLKMSCKRKGITDKNVLKRVTKYLYDNIEIELV